MSPKASSSSAEVASSPAASSKKKDVVLAGPATASRLAGITRFGAIVATSIVLSSVLYTAAAQYIGQSFAGVSRRLDSPWQIGGLVAWRTFELGVGWVGGYNDTELASLALLSHFPRLFLLTMFYSVPPAAGLGSLAIELFTIVAPFSVVRRFKADATATTVVKTHLMTKDPSLKIYTTVLASAIYSLAVYWSLRTWLPAHLVTYFYGLKDITAAHSINVGILTLAFLPIGYAASQFIFVPSAAYTAVPDAKFDPKAATLIETLRWNAWTGYASKTQVCIVRTGVLLGIAGLNTWIQTVVTVEGVDGRGALEWALVWDAATALTGLMFWWVIHI